MKANLLRNPMPSIGGIGSSDNPVEIRVRMTSELDPNRVHVLVLDALEADLLAAALTKLAEQFRKRISL